MIDWQPIETAPKDNKRPLLLAYFNDQGELTSLDFDGLWECEQESLPQLYWYWGSYNGIEEPTHWAYQPDGFAKLKGANALQQDDKEKSLIEKSLIAVIGVEVENHG